jgi:hypothetical protein
MAGSPEDTAVFVQRMTALGLDPEAHDLAALAAAVARLDQLMTRLDTGPAEAEALPVFDPRAPL